MRTENASRMVGQGTNALASSIVLACRRRPDDAPLASRRELVAALRDELPPALRLLQSEDIAPVDLAQAAIGPGMRVYTRYARVLRASGEPVPVREALALINEVLDEVLEEQEGELDAPTRWAVEWFRQHGFQDAPFGDAETLSKAKAASVEGMVAAGIVTSAGGRVRLVAPEGLPENWDPANAAPLTAWAAVHHLCRQLDEGKDAAAGLLRRLGSTAETARDLAYRLYASCEKKGWSADAFRYNALVRAWPDLRAQALGSGAGRKGARLL